MTDRDNVVESAERFKKPVSVESPEQRKQQRQDGEAALRKLRETKKLSQRDRELIAGQIGWRIQTEKADRTHLAKLAGLEPKELYRLVLKPGEQAKTADRLRAKGENYAALIETLARIVGCDLLTLASKITYGASIHPSGEVSRSEMDRMLNLVYALADGIDDEFGLSEKFKAIAEMKLAVAPTNPWTYWPADHEDTDWYGADPDTYVEGGQLRSSFWPSTAQGETGESFSFHNWLWHQTLGYLPHFFLGLEGHFWDDTYWPPTEEFASSADPETDFEHLVSIGDIHTAAAKSWEIQIQWMRTVPRQVLALVGGKNSISTAWDKSGETLLFNEEPALAYRRRLFDFQLDFQVEAGISERQDRSSEEDTFGNLDPLIFFWICIYPNRDSTGVIPIILSTNWGYGSDNMIEVVDEGVMRGISQRFLIDEESIWTKLRRALAVRDENDEPLLKKEWRRTAPFVDLHPLSKMYSELLAAERHVKNWREQMLRSGVGGKKSHEPNR